MDNILKEYFESKLFSKLSNQQKVQAPYTLIKELFTKEDLTDIREKVFSYKNLFQYLDPNNQDAIPVRILPAGSYTRSKNQYKKDVNLFRSRMYEMFSEYYNKILESLQQKYDLPLRYPENKHYPGFHIFGIINQSLRAKYNHLNFHKDEFRLPNINLLTSISSFIIPISLPKEGGALLYILDDIKKNEINSFTNYQKFNYEEGALHTWPGKLIHSIAPFNLEANEYRITMQFHLAHLNKEIQIFW